ncbi:MAG: hypothetical protein GY820_24305, partial [Gammaproteobacteria bacterium]|nr:hypothetical protein [Gammaproteobacteria bacterium]
TTDYIVHGVGDESGGNVILFTGATTGDILTLYRDMALERLTDYQNNGDFLADDVNTDYDRVWAALQQNKNTLNSAIRPAITDTILNSSNTELAEPSVRANKVLGFTSTGELDYLSGSVATASLREYITLSSAVSDVSSMSIGDVLILKERTTGNKGGAVWDVVDATTVTEDTYSIVAGDATRSLVLRISNPARLVPEQFGVTYGGAGIIETAALQATIDKGRELLLLSADTDGSFAVEINGYIRIDDTIDAKSRTRFIGISTAKSRIIWSGGLSTKAMINYGAASWGGLSDIRLQGYDQHDGQTNSVDGCQHLIRYTFVDFMHYHSNVHFVGATSHALVLEDIGGGATNTFVNMQFYGLRWDPKGTGYFFKIETSDGGRRYLGIKGITVDNSGATTSGGIIDSSLCTTGITVEVTGGRLEFNSPLNRPDGALFNMGGSAGGNTPSTVTLVGLFGYGVGLTSQQAIVRERVANSCNLTTIGCDLAFPSMYSPTTGEERGLVNNDGLFIKTTTHGSIVVNDVGIISASIADRNAASTQQWRKGNIAISENDDVDFITPTDANNSGLYAFAATGYGSAGKLLALNNGSDTATLDITTAVRGLRVGLNVSISGAGVAGATLVTQVSSIDHTNLTVTFTDTASTSIVDTSIVLVGSLPFYGYLKPRTSLPPNPQIHSLGSNLYITSLGCEVTWDGSRWMYDNHSGITGDRPSYVNSVGNRGRSYYDTTINKPIWWNGTVWKDATGTTV